MANILQKATGFGAAITVTTTTETLVAYSGRAEISFQTIRALVKGWLQIATGTGTTGLQLRLRRGNGVGGSLLAGGNTQVVSASATDDFNIISAEQLLNQEYQDYSFTVQQVGATGNATVNLGSIEVEMING
jgi:hypothetical protein